MAGFSTTRSTPTDDEAVRAAAETLTGLRADIVEAERRKKEFEDKAEDLQTLHGAIERAQEVLLEVESKHRTVKELLDKFLEFSGQERTRVNQELLVLQDEKKKLENSIEALRKAVNELADLRRRTEDDIKQFVADHKTQAVAAEVRLNSALLELESTRTQLENLSGMTARQNDELALVESKTIEARSALHDVETQRKEFEATARSLGEMKKEIGQLEDYKSILDDEIAKKKDAADAEIKIRYAVLAEKEGEVSLGSQRNETMRQKLVTAKKQLEEISGKPLTKIYLE